MLRFDVAASQRLSSGKDMRDIEYVVELAKAYGRAVISRDELQNEIHSCSLGRGQA
jgi:hypothetical protein